MIVGVVGLLCGCWSMGWVEFVYVTNRFIRLFYGLFQQLTPPPPRSVCRGVIVTLFENLSWPNKSIPTIEDNNCWVRMYVSDCRPGVQLFYAPQRKYPILLVCISISVQDADDFSSARIYRFIPTIVEYTRRRLYYARFSVSPGTPRTRWTIPIKQQQQLPTPESLSIMQSQLDIIRFYKLQYWQRFTTAFAYLS